MEASTKRNRLPTGQMLVVNFRPHYSGSTKRQIKVSQTLNRCNPDQSAAGKTPCPKVGSLNLQSAKSTSETKQPGTVKGWRSEGGSKGGVKGSSKTRQGAKKVTKPRDEMDDKLFALSQH